MDSRTKNGPGDSKPLEVHSSKPYRERVGRYRRQRDSGRGDWVKFVLDIELTLCRILLPAGGRGKR